MNGWTSVIVALVSAGLGGGFVMLVKAPGDIRRTDAETGKTKTQDATLLVNTTLAVVTALNEQVERSQARVRDLDTSLTAAQKQLGRAQLAVNELEDTVHRLTIMTARYEELYGPLPAA